MEFTVLSTLSRIFCVSSLFLVGCASKADAPVFVQAPVDAEVLVCEAPAPPEVVSLIVEQPDVETEPLMDTPPPEKKAEKSDSHRKVEEQREAIERNHKELDEMGKKVKELERLLRKRRKGKNYRKWRKKKKKAAEKAF